MIDFSNISSLSKNDIKKMDAIEKSVIKDIKKIKKGGKKKGGEINESDLSLNFIDPNKYQKQLAKTYINDANLSLLEFKKDGIANFKAPIKDIGYFKIQSVNTKTKEEKKPKLIIGIYNKSNIDLIHISIFIYSFIHITFNFYDKNYQFYFLNNPNSINGWRNLKDMVIDIYDFLTNKKFSPIFFNHNDKWKLLTEHDKNILNKIILRLEILLGCLNSLNENIPFIHIPSSSLPSSSLPSSSLPSSSLPSSSLPSSSLPSYSLPSYTSTRRIPFSSRESYINTKSS